MKQLIQGADIRFEFGIFGICASPATNWGSMPTHMCRAAMEVACAAPGSADGIGNKCSKNTEKIYTTHTISGYQQLYYCFSNYYEANNLIPAMPFVRLS